MATPSNVSALPSAATGAGGAPPRYTDIFVAVHGIGEQNRNETVQGVGAQLARAAELKPCWRRAPVATQPLGYFQGDGSTVIAPVAEDDTPGEAGVLIGLAEVYWADIPRRAVMDGRTLEETKAWAATVVARAEAVYREAKADEARAAAAKGGQAGLGEKIDAWRRMLAEPDFALGAEVLDQMIETIYVVETLLGLLRKAGLASIDISGILNDFLGDVQLVTEFAGYRLDVVGRFHARLDSIYQEQAKAGNADVRVHIIAHSEGTVVSFLALLHALSGHRVTPQGNGGEPPSVTSTGSAPEWLGHVHSLMTIGSPIDKHLLLWPALWTKFKMAPDAPKTRIRWRNYYDVGDPVGFKLETARLWLEEKKISTFEFESRHDIGFSRYLVAGKAHVDYWQDDELFAYHLSSAVFAEEATAGEEGAGGKARFILKALPPPKSRAWVSFFAPALPYLLCLALLMVAVGTMGWAVGRYVLPVLSPTEENLVRAELGFAPPDWDVATPHNLVGLTLLIAGVTLLARLPRLSAEPRWKVVGGLAFALGAVAFARWVDRTVVLEVGYLFSMKAVLITVPALFWLALGGIGGWWRWVAGIGAVATTAAGYRWWDAVYPMSGMNEYAVSIYGTLLLALTVAFAGLAVTRRGNNRHKRWLRRGMRPLILAGALVVVAMVWKELLPVPLDEVKANNYVTFETTATAEAMRVQKVRFDIPYAADDRRLLWWDLQALAPMLKTPDRPSGFLAAKAAAAEAKAEANDGTADVALWRLQAVILDHPPLWTVVVATAGGLYLWWLAALLFDLTFVWHLYVRRQGFHRKIDDWRKRRG